MEGVFLVLLVLWVLCGVAAAAIGQTKGEGCLAFVVGVVLGPFGILFAVLSRGNRKRCPFCQELIHESASVCPHCQREWLPRPPPGLAESIGEAQSASAEASAESPATWRLIVDRRAVEQRRDAMEAALRDADVPSAPADINEREVIIASALTLEQANALMMKLNDLGIASRKQRDE
jgi:hypothetical protein